MSDSNRAQLSFAKENAWGLFPTSAGTPQVDLRMTGESFGFNIANITSAEIRSDRQITDLIQTGADVSGGFNFELSYDDNGFAELFKGALYASTWSTPISSYRSSLEMDAGATYGYLALLGYQNFTSFVTGQWVKVTGFSTSGATATDNGSYFIVNCRTTGLDVLPNIPVNTTSTDNGTANGLLVQGCYVRNGTTESSYSFERYHADVTQYFDFKGNVPNTLALTATANAVINGSFGFIGKAATRAASAGSAQTHTDAAETDVMTGITNVGRIMEGYPSQTAGSNTFSTIDSSLVIQQISFNLTNNVRGLSGLNYLGFLDIGVGNLNVTGTLNAYFKDGSFYDKYIASTATGLAFELKDGDGNTYIFTFPKIKISTEPINVGGQNQDVMDNISWQAIRHPTLEYTMQIDKMPAV